MTTIREAAELALKAIEQGETFGYLENVVAPTLEAALKQPEQDSVAKPWQCVRCGAFDKKYSMNMPERTTCFRCGKDRL